MPATATSRLQGLTTSVAVKAPCKAVSTTALTLSGEQTVGGTACVDGDRVLYALSGGSVNNGIWVVSTGAWSRAADFDGNRDVVTGTIVGVVGAGFYEVTTSGDITIGTTSIAFAISVALGNLAAQLASALSASYGTGMVGDDPALAYPADTAGRHGQQRGVTPRMFGAVGDADGIGGGTDDTVALQAWAAAAFPHLLDDGVSYKLAGALSMPKVVEGRGGRIVCTAAGVITTTGTLTQIADLSVSPSAGDQTLTFGSAHTLVEDDAFVIYNPTNGSYSTARNEYKAGEFCRVALDPLSTTVDLCAPLHAGYTAGNVDVYKMTRCEVSWRNLSIIGPDAVVPAVKISLATRVHWENVYIPFANYMANYFDRCLDIEIHGGGCNAPKTGTSDCFGLFFGNSQNANVFGGNWYALRNAVDCGGDNLLCCVPTRNVTYHGSRISNDTGVSAAAANSHGNAENVLYAGCDIKGGGAFDGRNIRYIGGSVSRAALGLGSLISGGSECLGGIYEVRGVRLVGGPAYANGLVRVYNGANAQEAFHVIVEDNPVTLGSCDTYVRVDTAVATHDANASVDGVDFTDGAASLTNVLRMVGTGAGGTADYCKVDNVSNAPGGGTVALFNETDGFVAAKVQLMEQTGTADVVTANGAAAFHETAVVFPLNYGDRVPQVFTNQDQRLVGAKATGSHARAVTELGFQAALFTCDAAAFAAVDTVAVAWTAKFKKT
jgi:hypothetical protein